MSNTKKKPAKGSYTWVSPDELYIIGLDTDDGPEHALWDERINYPLDERKILNVMSLGVKVPVICKRASDGDLVVLDGRQRVRWSREANKRLVKQGEPPLRVKVIIERVTDEKGEAISVATNAAREEDSLLVKARKLARLVERGYSVAEAADFSCVTPQTARNWLKLAEMPNYLSGAVDKGEVTMTDAIKLAKAEKPKEALAEHKKKKASKKTSRKNKGTGKPAKRDRKPLKKWQEAMALDDKSTLSEPCQLLLEWLLGKATTEECEKKIKGFKSTLARAKRTVKKEESAAQTAKDKAAIAAGKSEPSQPEETAEDPKPKAKPKKKSKPKAKPKKKTEEKPKSRARSRRNARQSKPEEKPAEDPKPETPAKPDKKRKAKTSDLLGMIGDDTSDDEW